MKIVDSRRMSTIDSRAQSEYAMPARILMENAGLKAYAACRDLLPEFRNSRSLILFVAGSGNNGGDALVMARQAFLDGVKAAILLSGPVKSETSAANLEIVRKLGVKVVSLADEPKEAWALLRSASVILDGLFGTGVSGPLRAGAAALVEQINKEAAKVLALDLPSGLGDGFKRGYPVIRADITLCLGLPKACLYLPAARASCGRIVYLPIGFPPELINDPDIPGELLQYDAIDGLLPPIPADAHKGTRGKLAVFAGSAGTTGAPVLACQAAARARCGLVYLFIDETVYTPVASSLVSVMARPWRATDNHRDSDLGRFDAYLAGPGWGFDGRTPWLEKLVGSGLKGVLDADALTLLSNLEEVPDLGGNAILTPHPGEMGRLLRTNADKVLESPLDSALRAAERYNAAVVLKSHITTVVEPGGKYWVFDCANPALGTGGTGDVLSGLIAGLLSGGLGVSEAACLGVLIHGKAAERAFSERGWFLAEDLPPYISKVLAGVL